MSTKKPRKTMEQRRKQSMKMKAFHKSSKGKELRERNKGRHKCYQCGGFLDSGGYCKKCENK